MAATRPELVTPAAPDVAPPVNRAGVKIEYAAELIDRIRAETVKAFLSLPHGGLEIAGVLFGSRRGRTIYLAAARKIECEHAGGPSFILSERDESQLEKLISDSRTDPDLEDLEPLGWFVSHTRRPPTLTPGESALFDRFFPEPLQLTAVVHPEPRGAAAFRWFVRNDDGSVDPERASYEFTVQPAKAEAPRAVPEAPPSNVIALRGPSDLARTPREQALAPAPRRRVTRIRVSNLGLAATGLSLLMVAAAALWWFMVRIPPEYAPPLHVQDIGEQLRINWNPGSPAVQHAQSGELQIKDATGDPVRLNLSPEMIRNGSVLYNRPSNKVEIVLRLRDEAGNVKTSMVYFIGPEQVAKKAVPDLKEAEAITAPVAETARVEPVPQERLVPKPTAQAPPVQPPSGAADRATSIFRPPSVKKAPASEPSLIEPPKMVTTSSPAQDHGAPLIAASVNPAPAPVAPVVPEPAKTRPAQPTSGRLIWTGELRKNVVLHISDQGVSIGSLNGKLPAQAVKVSARSAELLDGAIAVYTLDPNVNLKAEAPGRRNGWNVTMYKFDPKHAHDLEIIETPSEKNHWTLGIKSVNRAVSMIVVDWQTAVDR